MTRSELFAALGRRWNVVAAILLMTLLGMGFADRVPGVYSTEVNVVFLPPDSTLQEQTASLTNFAAAVERVYKNGLEAPNVSSSSATLYGSGVRRGSSVKLADAGGQWGTNFNRPVLVVDVVDSSADAVQATLAGILTRISAVASGRQLAVGVAPENFIKIENSPPSPVISYVGGSRQRALVGLGALGVGLSFTAALLTDRWALKARRRAQHRAPHGAAASTATAVPVA
jgi:hypothetical protein